MSVQLTVPLLRYLSLLVRGSDALESFLSGMKVCVLLPLIVVFLVVVVKVCEHPAALDVAIAAICDLESKLLPEVSL